jgi:hypothetical protein
MGMACRNLSSDGPGAALPGMQSGASPLNATGMGGRLPPVDQLPAIMGADGQFIIVTDERFDRQ